MASNSSSSSSCQKFVRAPDDLGSETPAQPVLLKFPTKVQGARNRSFVSKWYYSYTWLEYSVKLDKAFCFACRHFLKDTSARSTAFTTDGYDNWAAAMESEKKGLKQHNASRSHGGAMGAWEEFKKRQKGQRSIKLMVNDKVVSDNRYYLNAVFDCLKFLILNEISQRGKKETIGSLHDPTEELTRGKFLNLLEFTIARDPKLKTIAGSIPANAKYTSPKIQNEVITIFQKIVQRKITNEVLSSDSQCFCVKADGTRDKNNVENICIVLQYVLNDVTVQRLLAIVATEDLDASSITDCIVGTLEKCDLPLDMIVSQCYDGASVMSGVRGGVQELLRQKVGRDILYIHCFNHQLHLAVVHAMSHEPKIGQYFEICGTMYNFLRRQPVAKRYDGDSLKRLLDNRWSGHLDTVRVVRQNLEQLTLLLLDVSNSTDLDGEIVAIASGLLQKIITPEFQFLTDLMYSVLSTLEPINRQLQSDDGDLATAVQLIDEVKANVVDLKADAEFEKIKVSAVNMLADGVEVGPPKRKRRLPARLKDSIVMTPIPHLSSVDTQKRLYKSAMDSVEAELNYRFSETRMPIADAVNAFNPSHPGFLDVEKMAPLAEAYSEDIDMSVVEDEAKIARRLFKRHPTTSFYQHRTSLQNLYALYVVSKTIGASTAVCESAFSTLTRLLTPYRRSMGYERLSSLVALSFESAVCDDTMFEEFLVEFKKSPRRLLFL